MLGLCLLAILTGFATSYNINNYEPLIRKPDPLHRWNSFALWALLAASVVNVGYAQLLMTLVWLPLGDLVLPRTRHRYRRTAARHPHDLRDSGTPSLCPTCTRAATPLPSSSPKATM
jgi:hypothetical protein